MDEGAGGSGVEGVGAVVVTLGRGKNWARVGNVGLVSGMLSVVACVGLVFHSGTTVSFTMSTVLIVISASGRIVETASRMVVSVVSSVGLEVTSMPLARVVCSSRRIASGMTEAGVVIIGNNGTKVVAFCSLKSFSSGTDAF